MLILIDNQDNVIGYETKENCHKGEGLKHRAVSIFILNSKNQLLIQKRSKFKPLWHDYWANSCCTNVRKGETYIKAAEKRLQEELGFTAKLKPLFKFSYKAKFKNIGSENELDYVLLGNYSGEIKPNPKEIQEYKWINLKDLEQDMKTNRKIYAPWFLIAFKKFQQHI